MPLSRFRLRLAGWFALAFLVGLLLLSLTLYLYLRRENERRFTRELTAQAGELAHAVRIEFAEDPGHGVAAAVRAALEEWPLRPEAFGLYGADGRRLAVSGPADLVPALPATFPPKGPRTGAVQPAASPVRLAPVASADPPFVVVAAGTTRPLEADAQALALWLLVSVPTTVLLSLVAGYVLSRRALRPVSRLERATARIAPEALDRRLPVGTPPDELDRLAARFNELLERLQQSQAQNRQFLQHAAHQIRTPLTLVLGETELALEHAHGDAAGADALRRIRLAAMQMRRRVEELLLLARASAGERASLTDCVELDGLALECVDLMRSRAHALGCHLELGRMDPVLVSASEALLREALVELLENACRHGNRESPVRLSVAARGREAVVEIGNAASDAVPWTSESGPERGLGLQVVRWIAAEHGGRLVQEAEAGSVRTALYLPTETIASSVGME